MIVIFDFSISPIGHNATPPIFISDFPQNARYPFELQRKKVAFSIAGKGNLLRFGFSPAPAPRTLHPGTSFARWTSSTVLCPLAAVHFALRSRQTLCPFENNLFHRTYLCRSLFAEAEGRSFFAERCRHPGGGFCAVLRGFGAYFSSPWAYPQQTAFRVFRSPCLSLCQPALFLGKRSIPWLWRCAFCAVSVSDSGRSLWAVPLQPPGRPSSRWGLRPCAFCARSFRRLGVLCRFRICGFCASKRIPTSEFSLDLESRFADFRVLGPSRWLPVDGESVRTRFPPGSIAFWRLCALVLCFCLCPPKFCASRFGKSRSMEKEFPSFFVWFFRVLRRVSAGTAPEAAIFPLCLCRSIVGFFRSSGCCVLRVFRASAPALPPIPASPEEFRFQGFLLIGRAASLALLLGLPPAVFSPSDDFFELPLSRSLYATPLLHPYQTHAIKAFARSISGSRRHATAGDLGLFSIRHWKRPLSFFLSIL